jgi:hypothetical protein
VDHADDGGKQVLKDSPRPGAVSTVAEAIITDPTVGSRRRTADRVFQGSLAYATALTLLWLALLGEGESGGLFGQYQYDVTWDSLTNVLTSYLFFTVLWGWIWYGAKNLLLRSFVGMSREERQLSFTPRMREPFDLDSLLARYSERRIRIVDMISRRGRGVILAASSFWFLYLGMAANPEGGFTLSLGNNLFEAVVSIWVTVALYYSGGFLGRMHYGAQSRIMDGVLARANLLLITVLWSLFKFVMVPIGIELQSLYPSNTLPVLFILIWGSYIVSDSFAEIVGSLFGKQKLRVWGLGDINRKSVAGTWATFLSALAFSVCVVLVNGLSGPWLLLALAIAVSNTLLELFSPRGTDDFTMATGNALVCWGFGLLMY